MKKVIQEKGGAIFFLLFVLIIWELLVKITETPTWLLPAPSLVFQTGIQSFSQYFTDVLSTIRLTSLGFIIGSLTGFVLAVILHIFNRLRQMVYPFLILSQNIPIIVLAPLLIIWFGFGILPKLIVIGLVCFFPVVVAALDGFKNTPSELRHYMEMVGASKTQIFWKLGIATFYAFVIFRIKNFGNI